MLGNLLSGKGIVRAGSGRRSLNSSTSYGNKNGKGIVRAGYGKKMGFLMLPRPLKNFEIQKYYQNEPRFNGVYSRNNPSKKIKDGAYMINLDEHVDVDTHWIALFCNRSEIAYFDSFGIEHAPEEIK